MDDVAAIILAAGKGTRMKSDLPKVLHTVAGKSMLHHVIASARKICPDHLHVVVGHQAERVKQVVSGSYDVRFALQTKLLGTGDAVKAALPDLAGSVQHVLVLCGDVPLIQADTLKELVWAHRESNARVTVLAVTMEDPAGYGRIVMDEGGVVTAIREEADAIGSEKEIKTVNSGIYCFEKTFLQNAARVITPDNRQAEYYLTDTIAIAFKNKQKIGVLLAPDSRQVIGVNTLEELELAERLIHKASG